MIKLPATDKTPRIEFDTSTGVLYIEGKSLDENAFDFYQPLIEKISTYSLSPSLQTTVHINLEYFNTISSKALLDVFRKLEKIKTTGEVVINWYYEREDPDMLEMGEDFREIVDIPFKMIELD